MLMTTIPRRYIYEALLELEDIILEMQALIFNEEYYDNNINLFNNEKINLLKKSFFEIIATLPLFLENLKFEKQEDMFAQIEYYHKNKQENIKLITKNKNIKKQNKKLILDLIETFEKLEKITTYKKSKEIFYLLDKFDHAIPKILELRRDHMK